jgi:hypothetical protein
LLAGFAGREVWIVTNSDTHAVAGKLEALDRDAPGAGWLVPRVRGGARKFDIDDSWTGVASDLSIPGLSRPVLLRRRSYYDILETIVRTAGAGFGELIVVGDVFELDLALPLALGARVGLVASPRTPSYERAFVASHPRGRVLDQLSEIAEFV